MMWAFYAAVVVGAPLGYVLWHAPGSARPFRVLGSIAGATALLLWPTGLLPLVWVLLLAVMMLALGVIASFNVFSLCLLFVPRRRGREPAGESIAPAVTVLIPARDEARVIGGCLEALGRVRYPIDRLTVIVIDDASTDATAEIALAYQDRLAGLRVIRRGPDAARGKAAALNEALACTADDLICILDADHEVAETFFSRAVPHFRDPGVGGVQGRIIGRNWSRNVLTRLLALELFGWQYSYLHTRQHARLAPVSLGSGCLFRRAPLEELGGFDNDLATEDLEISFRLYEAGYRIAFEPQAETRDELVTTPASLFRQRYRWARGATQVIPAHARRFLRGRATTRQKLDFLFFYPALLGLMIVPCLQLAVHALAKAATVDLPFTPHVPIAYSLVATLGALPGAVRVRSDTAGARRLTWLEACFLGACTGLYHAALVLPASARAFVDEFVLSRPYVRTKARHAGRPTPGVSGRTGEARFSRPSREEDLLVAYGRPSGAVRPQLPASLLSSVDWTSLERLARFHGVAGLLHASLVRHGVAQEIPAGVRESLSALRRDILARNLLLQHAWRAIARALGANGVDVIPLKGIYFIERFYALDVRPLHDIDFLVRLAQTEAANRVLHTLGYQEMRNPNVNLIGTTWRTQRSFRHPTTGVAIDLHWDLVNMSGYNRICAYPIDELWQRARRSCSDPHLLEMAPEDLLLQNALHCAIHHGFTSWSQLVDLAEIARDPSIDWNFVGDLAARYRMATPLYFALALSGALADNPALEPVSRRLRPSWLRRYWVRGYLIGQRVIIDSWISSRARGKLRWSRELMWPGVASVILADRVADSIRVLSGLLTLLLATKRRNGSTHRPTLAPDRSA